MWTFMTGLPVQSGGLCCFACDNWNFNSNNPCWYAGGNYNQNQNHGLFYMNCNNASNANSNIGSRILRTVLNYIPQLYGTGSRAPLGEDKQIWEAGQYTPVGALERL